LLKIQIALLNFLNLDPKSLPNIAYEK